MNGNIQCARRVLAAIAAITLVLALGQISAPSTHAAQDAFVSTMSKHNFNNTVKKLQKQIAAHKLAMLKKYNVQAMLKMVGVKSDKALTIAVFHPRYGKVIFASDKNAMSAAPLRMIVREQDGKVLVGYIRPSAVFAGFNVPDGFKKELDGLFDSIVKKATQ
jgi:uncharacterized protein (DUF302 family)